MPGHVIAGKAGISFSSAWWPTGQSSQQCGRASPFLIPSFFVVAGEPL